MRVSDYIMEKLSKVGVEHLFMITGRGVLYLSDAAAKCGGIEPIPMHHEQACAYAAYAYSAYNNKLGACLVSTGCASTNAITGVLCAWQDGIPCIIVSGQNTLKETKEYSKTSIRTWGQQEADIISIVKPITKYAVMITSAESVVYEVEKALYMATHGHKGPVWVDVPLDIQSARIEPDELEHYIPEKSEGRLISEDVDTVLYELASAKRPVILIGSGIRSADAIANFKDFVENTKIPVVYSASAPDIIPYSDPDCIGSVGMMACSRSGNFALQNSDFILVIGNRLSPMTTGAQYEKFARKAKIFVIDIDVNEHTKGTVHIDKLICTDAKVFLLALAKKEIILNINDWRRTCEHWKKTFPLWEDGFRSMGKVDLYELAGSLSDTLPNDAIFITDAGLEELILPSNISFSGERRCIHPTSQGAMGFGLPAAIGAYYASKKPVVAVIGDGSIMMNMQEFSTIAYRNLPIKIIIIDNNAYSVIRHRQKELFRNRTVGTDVSDGVPNISFEKMAVCFGIEYSEINNPIELNHKLMELFGKDNSVICIVRGVEDQGYVSSSYAKTSEKKFVQRPLEDQAPYLDRALFLREMIIDPIDQ